MKQLKQLLNFVPKKQGSYSYGKTSIGFRSIVLHSQKAIYTPIPKVACTSLKTTFLEILDLPKDVNRGQNIHIMPLPYVEKEELPRFKDYWKFAFVRNPYERLVSCYRSKIKSDKNFENHNFKQGIHRQFLKYGCFKANMTFSDFVHAVCEIPDENADSHFKSQHKFIATNDDKFCVDFIGRFEKIEEDFEYVARKISAPSLNLSYINKSDRQEYKKYYKSQLVQKVYERYSRDLELFGYNF